MLIDELEATRIGHAVEISVPQSLEPRDVLGRQGHHCADAARVAVVAEAGIGYVHEHIVTG